MSVALKISQIMPKCKNLESSTEALPLCQKYVGMAAAWQHALTM